MNRLRNFLTNTFIGGVVVLLPLAIFAILAKWIFGFFSGILEPIISLFPNEWNTYLVELLAIVIVTAFCFFVGLGIRTQIGTGAFNFVEKNILKKLPLYSTIKEAVQQFVAKEKTPFSKVVYADPYKTGAKMVGFVTDESTSSNMITIFIPTAPNPTSGYLFVLDRNEVMFIDIKAEKAMKNILSVGTGTIDMLENHKLLTAKEYEQKNKLNQKETAQ